MKHAQTFSLLLILLCTASANAQQMYKWVGPDGKVTYSDAPPPPTVKQVEKKAGSFGGGVSVSNLPFELAETVKNHPVTLYTAPQCAPCDTGRALLTSRGVPFVEKTVTTNEDIEHLRQAEGASQLPVLVVGRKKQKGLQSGEWSDSLTAAGYPATSKLPASYRNPSPIAAAPPAKTVAAAKVGNDDQAASRPAEELPPAIGNAPPGFRF